jgi:hypothetical protein
MMDFDDLKEGELALRLQCNMCQGTGEFRIMVADPDHQANLARLIEEEPQPLFDLCREAGATQGWTTTQGDSGTFDICPECSNRRN